MDLNEKIFQTNKAVEDVKKFRSSLDHYAHERSISYVKYDQHNRSMLTSAGSYIKSKESRPNTGSLEKSLSIFKNENIKNAQTTNDSTAFKNLSVSVPLYKMLPETYMDSTVSTPRNISNGVSGFNSYRRPATTNIEFKKKSVKPKTPNQVNVSTDFLLKVKRFIELPADIKSNILENHTMEAVDYIETVSRPNTYTGKRASTSKSHSTSLCVHKLENNKKSGNEIAHKSTQIQCKDVFSKKKISKDLSISSKSSLESNKSREKIVTYLANGLSSTGTAFERKLDLQETTNNILWKPPLIGTASSHNTTNRAKAFLREVALTSGYLKPVDRIAYLTKQGLFETSNAKPSVINWKTQTSAWLKTHDKANMMKAEYSKAKLAELRQLFDLLDADGSGEVAADEVGAALLACGIKVTPQILETMFGSIGKDINDELTFADFANMMSSDSGTYGSDNNQTSSESSEPEVSISFALIIITFRRKMMLEENVDIFDSSVSLDVESMLRIASDFKDFKKKEVVVVNKINDKDAFEIALDRISAIKNARLISKSTI